MDAANAGALPNLPECLMRFCCGCTAVGLEQPQHAALGLEPQAL